MTTTAVPEIPLPDLRADFPALEREVHPGIRLTYLDNAATTLKPWPVIRAVQEYDAEYPANVHRGIHTLSEQATGAFETAREKVAGFVGARSVEEIVWTRGTTDAINLVAQSWSRAHLTAGDEIVLNDLEHHANIVPWQIIARERGLVLKFAEITEDGRLELDAVARLMTPKTKIVSVTAMSNVLGTIPPLAEIVGLAHDHGAKIVVDAAQGVPHGSIDVDRLQIDFLAFSGHKVCGPTGIGVLFGRRELLESMPPMLGGGGMITRVTRDGFEWDAPPARFEAGTPAIAQAIGLGAAIDYLATFDSSLIAAHERQLMKYAHSRLIDVKGVQLLGPEPVHKGGIVSFNVDGVHPHDLSHLVDRAGVAIRAGQHCAKPLHDRLGLVASVRASVYVYNTTEDIDRLAEAIEGARQILGRRNRARA